MTLSFCIESIEHEKAPLKSIPKFFLAHDVGIVSHIDVVEYIEVETSGATPNDNFRRLYVHFLEMLDNAESFKEELRDDGKEYPLSDEISIKISVNENTYSNNTQVIPPNDTFYAFTTDDNHDQWYTKTKQWSVWEQIGKTGIVYENMDDDKCGIYEYLENLSCEEVEERRVDLWNPVYNFKHKYASHCGAIAYTKEEYKNYYGRFWRHYWNDSLIFEPFKPDIKSYMKLTISVTLGPYSYPYNYAINNLVDSFKSKLQYLEEIYYNCRFNTYTDREEVPVLDWYCGIDDKNPYTNYSRNNFIITMEGDFMYLHLNDYYNIKNTLIDLEHMCEIIKPIDIYNSMPETRIYINFE